MQQYSSGDPEQRSGKRKSIGKRKLSEQGEPSLLQSQKTISELLSKTRTPNSYPLDFSTQFKRPRLSVSPSRSAVSPNKMYNFSGSPPKNGTAFMRSAPGSSSAAIKSQPFNASVDQNKFSPNVGARKLIVKNLRTGPRVGHEPYFDRIWSQLDAALTEILEGRKPEISLEELYKGAENICRQDRALMLAKKVQESCKTYVLEKLRTSLVTRSGGGTDVDTLRAVIEAWSSWHSKLVCRRFLQEFDMHESANLS